MRKSNMSTNTNRKFSMGAVSKFLAGWGLMIPTLLLVGLCVWRPTIIGAFYSLFKLQGFEPVEFVGLENYIKTIADANFVVALVNSVKFVLWSLVFGLPLPLIAAFLLNEVVHGKTFFKVGMYVPVALPAIAVYMIWKLLYQPGPNGVLNVILNTFGAGESMWLQNSSLTIVLIILVMTWHTFGSTTLYYVAALQGISQEQYEAAKIDGAGVWARIRHIMLPEVLPVVLLFAIRQIIGVFQSYEAVMTMTGGGPDNASLNLGLLTYRYAFGAFQLDRGLASSFITFILLMIITIIYFKLDNKLSS